MMCKTPRQESIRRGVFCIRVEKVRKALKTSTLKFNRCKKKRTIILIHCIKIAVLIWNKYLILIQMHPSCIMGAFCVVWCIFIGVELIIISIIHYLIKNINHFIGSFLKSSFYPFIVAIWTLRETLIKSFVHIAKSDFSSG